MDSTQLRALVSSWPKFQHAAPCLGKQCEIECGVFVRWTQPNFVP